MRAFDHARIGRGALLLAAVPFLGLAVATSSAADGIDLEVRSIAYVSIEGTILDGRSGTPIEGASVLAKWTAVSYGEWSRSTSQCLRLAGPPPTRKGGFPSWLPKGQCSAGASPAIRGCSNPQGGWEERPSGGSEDGRRMTLREDEQPAAELLTKGGAQKRRHVIVAARLYPSARMRTIA